MANRRGKFIVIDGMDGSGKDTQLDLLRVALKDLPVYYTHEPGGNGSPTAEFIRTVILEPHQFGIKPLPLCDFFLFWASRAQHVEEVVEPQRARGMHVISNRYDSSTWSFQIHGEQKEFEGLFNDIRWRLPDSFHPDHYIFFDLPAEVAYERRKRDAAQANRFDAKPLEYYERVRSGFRCFAQAVGRDRIHFIDANRPVEVIHAEVSQLVLRILQA